MTKQSWFTLIELVVAMAMIAIIFTVSYLTFDSWLTSTKDAYRTEDMLTLKAALSNTKNQNWGYPYPDSYFTIINSWTTNEEVYQWFITRNVLFSDLQNVPVDPKTGNNYILSTTKTKQQYQIAMTLETTEENKAFVDGDFNSPSIYLFPSLILAYSWISTQEIQPWVITNWSDGSVNRSKFVINWSKNNLIYSIPWWNIVQNNTTYNDVITEPWITINRNIDYYTCKELSDDKKFLWPWYYDMLSPDWSWFILTTCN